MFHKRLSLQRVARGKNSSEVLKCTKSVLDLRKNPSPVLMGICLTSRLFLKVANKHNMYPNFPQEKNTHRLDWISKLEILTVTKTTLNKNDYLPMLSLLFGLLDNRHTAMIRMD